MYVYIYVYVCVHVHVYMFVFMRVHLVDSIRPLLLMDVVRELKFKFGTLAHLKHKENSCAVLGIEGMGGCISGRNLLRCEGVPKGCLLAVEWGPLSSNVTPQCRPDGPPTFLSVHSCVCACMQDEELKDWCWQQCLRALTTFHSLSALNSNIESQQQAHGDRGGVS